MSQGLTLTAAELEELTGYRRPSLQLRMLHARGYFLAALSKSTGKVIVPRDHHLAVCAGARPGPQAIEDPTTRPRVRAVQSMAR